MDLMDLSVVVPVKNEQENIIPLIEEIHASLAEKMKYEMIFIDDGSTDKTSAILKEALSRFPCLRVLHHEISCGQSTAIRSGVKSAKAPWIATLDGDGQNDPADIVKMVAVVKAPDCPPDLWMVAGWRKKRHDNWLKRISSKIANGIRSRLLKDKTPDTGCGLKLFKREAFMDLPYFDHMHRFLPALVLRAGGQVNSIEVHHRPRKHGTSKYGLNNRLWVGIIDLFGVRWLQKRAKRPKVREVV
jgi:dolichol-phosphate mannosyltransferase